ncbi:MAG TPA: SDR family oxidoreductase [Ramlibacter sp.]|nr:SDR family oxidoreductase [Ramlibacter sp.]
MNTNLSGRTALVTGASAGIGRAIAAALAAEGMRVAIVARRRALLEELAGELLAGGAPAPLVIECDLMREDAADFITSQALAALGCVDVLVNNAGGSRNFTLETAEDAWHEAMTLNFTRQRQLTHRLVPAMVERRWGRVINIAGKVEAEGINGASCAKSALFPWAKGLSRQVGRHGITVNCISPGRIMSEQIRRNYTPEYRQWQSEHEIPLGRYGEPEDVARLAVFLASDLASYMTGTVIPVDGGLRRYQY